MKKSRLFLLPLLALTLTSCDISDFFIDSREEFSEYTSLTSLDNDITKTKLNYSMKDLSSHNMYNTPSMPTTGDVNILVIPTWFADSKNYINTTDKIKIKNDIQKAYFGTDSDTGWKSVSSYYKDASYGRLNLSGKVTDWWECGQKGTYITDNGVDILVKRAADWYKSNNSDISEYDADKDGYIDCICLIYGLPNSLNDSDTLWAYTYWLQKSEYNSKISPGPNTYFWASYDFMYSSGGGDNSNCRIDAHTYIHEMGHALGLNDYYDYANNTSYFNSPAGGFSMQDYNVGDHDPMSKMLLGWCEPYVPKDSCTINIHNFEASGECIVLSPNFQNSPFDEYIILELYTNTGLNRFDTTYRWGGSSSGYPKGPINPGFRIWHADSRLAYITSSDESLSASKVSSTITSGKYYTFAMSNTTYTGRSASYCSEISEFRNFNQLQLLRNSTSASYAKGDGHTVDLIKNTELWTKGSTFSMSQYAKQFYKSGKLNSGAQLGFEVEITYVSEDYATVKITKQ